MTARAGCAINAAMASEQPLRRGWTTGACATAAAKAAYAGLLTGVFPDPVEIALPAGQRVAFALAETAVMGSAARAGVVKDAGDDPDVTHGALVRATVRRAAAGSGITFRAGEGVGTVTRPGLPVPPGEPAINPVPRRMITAALQEVATTAGVSADVEVEIAIPGGERLAQQTLNPRLGIVGGLSILGTTGIVVPYSCAAWIHSIRSGIEVARAAGLGHVAGATGRTSEAAVRALYDLPEIALIDMGDFVGGMLKYLRVRPVRKVSIAGGVAKITKLAQGRLDLHSKRGSADLGALAQLAGEAGGSAELGQRIARANTVAEAFAAARAEGVALGERAAARARAVALDALHGAPVDVEVLIFDREGALVARAGFSGDDRGPDHVAASGRNRRA
ncbi:cobalt-precorrin-5B (C(1))-methyltransferase [Bradyrhizobium sp. WD16]|uniref:cobalt-precorrin-5B (C(1))-methyltransferase n=1 Tax=Bradyrhizobium sp. WD16 TaxID=1521768 RepID=UPI0020A3AE96|nr:cobalt-precorrin-5B (C(1))-methyltransferase [Bradyrhizobium sp. WD16]UTD27557.1 cobalt-precorrin-5B (C(1))-methyltransferase [Bradyrhizobium sp. WD16]